MKTKLPGKYDLIAFCLAAVSLLVLNGCSSAGANIVTITLTSSVSNNFIILGQSTTITATVNGANNVDVNWTTVPCNYTTTPINSTTPSAQQNCPKDGSFGTLTNQQPTGSATYTAPNVLPDQTKYPGLQIIITVCSVQDPSKCNSINLILDSGITATLTPITASVPTKEQQQFSVALTNDIQNKSVTWLITQQTPTALTAYPNLKTCSPTCGSIAPAANNPNLAVYTAPDTVPTSTSTTTTPADVTLVVTANADTSRWATGTITITAGGPITFNGISPTIAPQAATLWDVYLDAPNISSASKIVLTYGRGGSVTKDSSSGQIKVLFPIPTTNTPNPASTGARLRLNAQDLAVADSITMSITDPAETVTPLPGGVFTYNIIPVRATSTATVPDSIVQGAQTQSTPVIVDGGYFGPAGNLAKVVFQGNTIPQDSNHPSTSRQLNTLLSTSQINTGAPGLYPLSVGSVASPAPTPNNPSVTNIALFPDYSSIPPAVVAKDIPAGTNPSAVDIDPILGVLVVAETGSNAIQFYTIGNGTLTPLGGPIASNPGAGISISTPTGLSVNRTNHTVAVVNYGNQTVTVLPIPGAPTQAPGTPFTVDISGALQNSLSPAPIPYSIGVDPDSNLAMVAYSSTSAANFANLGFVVNLNPDSSTNPNPYGCGLDHAINPSSTKLGQCLYSQVTLNNGAYPQVAMAPHGHLAFVTPGGSGTVRGVDVTKTSGSTPIASSIMTAGVVTVTTTANHGLIPGVVDTVLITGVVPGNSANNAAFNGVFTISVTSNNSFTYLANSTATDTSKTNTGTVFSGQPNLIYAVSATAQGVAINPITHTAALADANATGQNGPQIDLLNSLDQTVTSIPFYAGCTAFTPACSNSAELLGTADVAWQPYADALVSYNPQQNQISVSEPVSAQRYALLNLTGTGSATLTVQNGTTNALTLFGGLAVDPGTNQAFVVKSGSGTIDVLNLGPAPSNAIKPAQITEVVAPSPTPAIGVIGGIPNALFPQAALTSTSPLAGVQIYGSGFDANTQVRLDGQGFASSSLGNFTFVGSHQITVTIPAAYLKTPHRYALDLINGNGVQSNVIGFYVLQSVDLSKVCTNSNGNPTNTQPTSVALADQLANGPFSPIAVVSVSGCNSIVAIDVNPASPTFGQILGNPIGVGTTPQGIAISQRYGLAVVANNGSNNASIINLVNGTQPVPAVATGTNPAGVAIDDGTGAAIVTNTGSNTVSELNLALLFPPSGTTAPTSLTAISIGGVQEPIAVAIDPDRGTNNQGLAVVSGLQLIAGTQPNGALYPVDIGLSTPALNTAISSGSVGATPTGVVFDPTVVTNTVNQGIFYANSSGSNVITTYNPDTGGGSIISVGINPTSLAINPQTGAILTTNAGSQTVSIVDTVSTPLKTRYTYGLPGSSLFGVAIDQFTNLAVIVDQAYNRVLIFPMPN